jgi:hypothetical protein
VVSVVQNIYSAFNFVNVKVDGSRMGSKTWCIKVPLNCENMIPRVVESEIEFKAMMKCPGKSICRVLGETKSSMFPTKKTQLVLMAA